jgi:hypothetical protein
MDQALDGRDRLAPRLVDPVEAHEQRAAVVERLLLELCLRRRRKPRGAEPWAGR